MLSHPLVSVVMPVYNAADFINDAIESIQEQDYQNWELICVDDASIDESVNMIKAAAIKDKRIRLISNEINSGVAKTRNIGIRNARGKYLAFLDADDMWLRTKLYKQVSFMQESEIVFSYTAYEFADENCRPLGKIVSVPNVITYSECLRNHVIWTSTVMIDLGQLNKHDILMPDIGYGEDTATWWNILRITNIGYGMDEVLSYYRRTKNSLSANKFKAAVHTWGMFTQVEKLGFMRSVYNFLGYGYNAARKRI